MILDRHQKHQVWGYHAIAASIRQETGWAISDNLVHKCCKAAGVRSKAKRYKYRKPGEESEIFPNLVRGRWNAARPLEAVVSDMTCIRCNRFGLCIIPFQVAGIKGYRLSIFRL